MTRGQWLACVLLGWLVLAPMSGHAQGVEAPDSFTCEDLVGLTYRVWILTQGFVCFDFISMDTVIQTYDNQQSYTVGYAIKGERLGVCHILTYTVFPPLDSLSAYIQSEALLGVGILSVRGGPLLLFPVIGQRVEPGECQPGR